jgi:hypothetical protein
MLRDQIVKLRMFYLLGVLASLPCLAAIVMWIVSFSFAFNFSSRLPTSRNGLATFFEVSFDRGITMLTTARMRPATPQQTWGFLQMTGNDGFWPRWRPGTNFYANTVNYDGLCSLVDFGHDTGPFPSPHEYWLVPTWLVALVAALPMLCWWRLRRRQVKHHVAGRCAHCGYDLRATPEICPECGMVADRVPGAING